MALHLHTHPQAVVETLMIADLKLALRQLRKSPTFALTAVLTLALGVGANTAIFALVDSILLRPLPFPHQDRLMRIGYDAGATETSFFPKGWIRALGEHSAAFAAISGFGADTESNIGDSGSSERVFGADVMANALRTLEINPALGRSFTADDALAGHDPVVILSNGFWREHFAFSPDVIGRSLRIDGVERRVIGVLPAGLRFPYADTEFLTPVTFSGQPLDPWQHFDLRAFGRLRPGTTPAQAQAELRRLQHVLLPVFPWRMPDRWASDMTVVSLLESQVGAMRPRLLLLFAAVALILLIACANVANLMLARATGREREIAIRSALGASTGRLMRHVLLESLLLSLIAGAAGLAAAAVGLRLLLTLLPADTPRLADVSLHGPVILFAALASVVTGFLFGLIPAFQISSPELGEALHSGSRTVAGSASRFRVSRLLVIGQIALSVLVITAACLMLRSLWALSQVNPGFQTERIVTAEVALDGNACATHGRCQQFFETLLDRARGIPGEENLALTDALPLTAPQGNYVYDAEGHPRDARQGALLATGRTVSPGYFATFGIPLLRGRLLDQQDASGASRAVIIDQRMADRLWPHQNPLGRHLLNVQDEPQPTVWTPNAAVTVVGVVADTHEGTLASGFADQVYLPMTPAHEAPVMYVVLRTRSGIQESAAALRRTVAEIDPQVPVSRVRSLNELVASSESGSRSLTLLLLAFGALAVLIGGVGVYSLIAYIVSGRIREFGIRLALGAQRHQILARVIKQSLSLALSGCASGLVAAALLSRLLRGFLYGVQPVDPLTFAAVALLMTLLAIAAAWAPAQRAAKVDPIRALRLE